MRKVSPGFLWPQRTQQSVESVSVSVTLYSVRALFLPLAQSDQFTSSLSPISSFFSTALKWYSTDQCYSQTFTPHQPVSDELQLATSFLLSQFSDLRRHNLRNKRIWHRVGFKFGFYKLEVGWRGFSWWGLALYKMLPDDVNNLQLFLG